MQLEKHLNAGQYDDALALLEENPSLINKKLDLEKNINNHNDNNTPLKVFAVVGHLNGVKKLLELGAETRPDRLNIQYNPISTLISVLYNHRKKIKADETKERYGDIIAELIKKDPTLIKPHEWVDIENIGLDKSKALKGLMPHNLDMARIRYNQAIEKARNDSRNDYPKSDFMQNPDVQKSRARLRAEQDKFYALLKNPHHNTVSAANETLASLDKVTILEAHLNNKDYDKALELLKNNKELINTKLVLKEDINNHPNNNTPLNVFIAAGHLKGVQTLLALGATPKKEMEGRGMGMVYEDPYDALSTMLDILESKKTLTDQEKKNYGNIAAALFKKDPELLDGRAYVNLNVPYDENHKANMINRIESLGLAQSDELKPIFSALKYESEIDKFDAAIHKLKREDPDRKDATKQAKISALEKVIKSTVTGGNINDAITEARKDDRVKSGSGWTTGTFLLSRTEKLLNELEAKVNKKNEPAPNPTRSFGKYASIIPTQPFAMASGKFQQFLQYLILTNKSILGIVK